MGRKYKELKPELSKYFEIFCSQDVENGFFDVTFQVGDEKLYAHKFLLAGVSKPFAVMFSERWLKKDEPIKISAYSFDAFKVFIGHIYYSDCKITKENVFTMVDMAEFYDVGGMKTLCDELLAKKAKIKPENIFQLFEFSQKYSFLVKFQTSIKSFMIQNLSTLFRSDGFMEIKKEMLKDMIDLERLDSHEEKLLEAVYKWAEYQAAIKQSSTEKEPFDINHAIKEELTDILPKIRFERMSLDFLFNFVVPKELITPQHLSDILQKAKKEIGPLVYTHGSSTYDGTRNLIAGFGVYWGDNHPDNLSLPVTGVPAHHRAEYEAILTVIKHARVKGLDRLLIRSNSKFHISSLDNYVAKWKRRGWKTNTGKDVANGDLIKKIDAMRAVVNVKFELVDVYGIHGSEMARGLARLGAEKFLAQRRPSAGS